MDCSKITTLDEWQRAMTTLAKHGATLMADGAPEKADAGGDAKTKAPTAPDDAIGYEDEDEEEEEDEDG